MVIQRLVRILYTSNPSLIKKDFTSILLNAEKYPFTVSPVPPEEGKGYYVSSPYFPGILVAAATIDAAVQEFQTVLADVICDAVENERPLPAVPKDDYSGKLSLRLSTSLHRQLAERAREEGVSINALIIQYIAQGLGGPQVVYLPAKERFTSSVSPNFSSAASHSSRRSDLTVYSSNNASPSTALHDELLEM